MWCMACMPLKGQHMSSSLGALNHHNTSFDVRLWISWHGCPLLAEARARLPNDSEAPALMAGIGETSDPSCLTP